MTMTHPFLWIEPAARKRAFAVLALLALLVMAALRILDAPLRTAAAPAGIIAFELAGSSEKALAILDSWSPQAKVNAGLSLGLDYLFMPLYAGAIGLGCVLVAAALSCRSPGRPGAHLQAPARRASAPRFPVVVRLGVLLAWGQVIALLLDAVENYALIRLLLGTAQPVQPVQPVWAVLAAWCAIPKFTLVILGLAYVLAGGLLALLFKPGIELEPVG